MNNEIWKDINYLEKNHKSLINRYFKDKKGKFIIKNNILRVDFENWGIETFFLFTNSTKFKKKYYEILDEKFDEIYSLAISIQIANWGVFNEMIGFLNNFKNINRNLYFVLIEELCNVDNINFIKNNFENYSIIKTKNRGMDIGLFLINLHYINFKRYKHDFLYKIHTKSDTYLRNCILTNLMGSHERIIHNLKVLSKPEIGMIGGSWIYNFRAHQPLFMANDYYIKSLIKYLYHNEYEYDYMEFVVATFFAVKMDAFKILNLNVLEYLYENLNTKNTIDFCWYSYTYNIPIDEKVKMINDFKSTPQHKFLNVLDHDTRTNRSLNALRDKMIEHALERIFGYIVRKCNLGIVHI